MAPWMKPWLSEARKRAKRATSSGNVVFLRDSRRHLQRMVEAGQTAPHPGVTIIKGGLTIATHDVVIRHLRKAEITFK